MNSKTLGLLFTIIISIPILILLTGCTPPEPEIRRIAFTSILPQKDFVSRIAGNRFKVYAFVEQGLNPHSFTPTAEQMARLSEATFFFRAGIEFEEGILPKLEKTMPQLRIVDLRIGIPLRDMSGKSHCKDDDNDSHADCCGTDGKDPHIWLSTRLVKKMGKTIKDALSEADPQGADVYDKNLRQFHSELDSLDAFLSHILMPFRGTELFVFHPAFGYFADDYGLTQKAVEIGGKEPSARALANLIGEARQYQPKAIFVQPQYAKKSAETLAKQIGCEVMSINPLPESYFHEMRLMGKTIQEGLTGVAK